MGYLLPLLLILFLGSGFLVWKYMLHKNSPSQNVTKISMKEPERSSIRMTQKFGLVPVTQFGIVLKEGLSEKDAQKIASDAGGIVTGDVDLINFYQIEIKSATAATYENVFNKLAQMPGVEMVSPNGLLKPCGFNQSAGSCNPMDDPIYQVNGQGRNYEMIGLKNAYAYIKASGLKLNPVKVGVMDTRIYEGTDELGGNCSSESYTTDITGNSTDPDKDENGNIQNGGLTHGTMVTQIIGANADNGGITGVASPMGNNLTIETANIFTPGSKFSETTPDPDDLSKFKFGEVTYVQTTIKVMLEQIKNGATVINCSFGPLTYSEKNEFETKLYEKFYQRVKEKYPKVVIVGAAGNDTAYLEKNNGMNVGQKADNLITVGAMNPDGGISNYSNKGTRDGELTISAPGDNVIHGMDKNGKPVLASGTSFAAPQVAGTVAMLQSINPDLTAAQIKEILTSTAQTQITGRDGKVRNWQLYGAGLLRVDQAVLKVINDMRAKKGLPALTPASMIDMNTVSLSYKGGPENYTITATINAISGNSTTLSIEVTGNNYSITGNRQQSLHAPGAITWGLSTTNPEGKLTVKVSRSDTKACAWVVIEQVDLSGVWDLKASLISADLFQIPPDVAEKSITDQQFPFGSLDVDGWKKAGWPLTKEGDTFVFTSPGEEGVTYYVEKITGDTFIGKATARANNNGHVDVGYYRLVGAKRQ